MSMIQTTARDSSIPDPSAVESLKMMLDYAIVEGAELNLPVFVLLLRMASLELAKAASGDVFLSAGAPSLRHAEERIAP
jgi:hypothetical protein